VKRAEIPDNTPSGGQGWVFNLRRAKFANPRLREALNYAFDFEWTNKTIMYGAYKRTYSVFENSDMMARGLPSAEELKLLEPWRGKVPEAVFAEPFVPPVSDGSGQDRALLRKASQMLQDAGFPIKNGKRVDAKGQPITIEFLEDDPQLQAHHGPFIKNLGILGIDATLRIVDPVQYRARRDDFDFDITMDRMGFSTTPGVALRVYFSSAAAARSPRLARSTVFCARGNIGFPNGTGQMAPGNAPGRLLGRIRPPGIPAVLCPRRSGELVV
jgi:microcin C transport system substrate-binding protein